MSMGVKQNLSMGALSGNNKRLPTLQFGHKFHLYVSNFTFPNLRDPILNLIESSRSDEGKS
jgi:hypothetical protein